MISYFIYRRFLNLFSTWLLLMQSKILHNVVINKRSGLQSNFFFDIYYNEGALCKSFNRLKFVRQVKIQIQIFDRSDESLSVRLFYISSCVLQYVLVLKKEEAETTQERGCVPV